MPVQVYVYPSEEARNRRKKEEGKLVGTATTEEELYSLLCEGAGFFGYFVGDIYISYELLRYHLQGSIRHARRAGPGVPWVETLEDSGPGW